MIKFVHTGDIHLGLQFNSVSFNRDTAHYRRAELWSTFKRIVDYSQDEDMDFLLIAGDLFESKYFTLGDMMRLRDIFKAAEDVNIVIAAGNHDYLGGNSLYKKVEWSDNVHIFQAGGISKIDFPELDTVIFGYSWDRVEIRNHQLFDDYDFDDGMKNRILLIHGDIGSNSNYLPLNLDRLKQLDLDYIGLGHIHKPEIFTNKIAYCGSPEPLDFGELGERGFIQGHIQDGETEVEFIPFSKREFLHKTIQINENMSFQDIYELIRNVDGNKALDYYRIELNGYRQDDIKIGDLQLLVKDDFHYIEIIDNTSPDYDLVALERDYRDSVIGEFIKEMKDKGLDDPLVKKALYYGLDALLKGRVDI